MVDRAISALTAATSLGDTDLVPIVQASETRKLTAALAKAYFANAPAIVFSTSAAVSAAGTTQATGTALTSDFVVVTTVAASAGVVLPTATVGRRIVLVNKGANALAVYPATGAAIDALGANVAISIPVGGIIEFNASTTTQWYSTANVAVSIGAVTGLAAGVATFLATPNSANLRSLVTDETGSGSLVFGTSPTITGVRETKTAPTISTNTLTLDCSAGNIFAVSLNANITTLTFTNVPTTGTAYALTLSFTADGTARTVTWGTAVKWPGGTAPTLTSTLNKVDTFILTTWDGGTTWYAFTGGQNA